jgi:antirestriction protein ArdC
MTKKSKTNKAAHVDPREKHGKLIIQKLEEALAKGTAIVPWRATWDPTLAPRNVRGNVYRGGNLLMTMFTMAVANFTSPFFLTFNQALEHGGIVKPGESGIPIIFWKWWGGANNESDDEPEDNDPRPGRALTRRATPIHWTVFNLDQCKKFEDEDRARLRDNMLERVGNPDKWDDFVASLKAQIGGKHKFNSIKAAEKIHKGYAKRGPKVEFGAAFEPCYIKSRDIIQLPNVDKFHSAAEYHSTRFHEEVHSTGHANRLARATMLDMKGRGDHNYSREELAAEFGASMLAAMCGIERETLDNTVAYLRGWLKPLKNDPKMLYSAAQDAQKATDYILNIEVKKQKEVA